MRINSDADKKIFVEKPTRDLMNQIAVNCQNVVKIIKLWNKTLKWLWNYFKLKSYWKKTRRESQTFVNQQK